MNGDPDWISLIPPASALLIALLARHVYLALMVGVLSGLAIHAHFDIAQTFVDTFGLFATLLTTPWILKTLGFVIFVGSIMELMRRSGGVDGFVGLLHHRFNLVRSRRSALLMVYLTGLVIFIESSITSLIAGAVGRPLAARFGFSREKLAYVCDSTAAPVCSLILFNGWGALLLGLILTQIDAGLIEGKPVEILLSSIFFNFYAMAALAMTFAVIWFNIDIGPMRQSKPEMNSGDIHVLQGEAVLMLAPLGVMVLGVFLFLWLSGGGDILSGSGSSAVFYTMLLTLLFMALLYRVKGIMKWREYFAAVFKGAGALLPLAAILLLAFAIGNVIDMVGTGRYLASFLNAGIAQSWLASAIFLAAAIMAFATGTSWGTFSIMLPIAVAMGDTTGIYMPLLIGAVISGGVFGDHCSPISDTTIIASLAAGCDHIDHVRTQLPYAILSGIAALILFLLSGVWYSA